MVNIKKFMVRLSEEEKKLLKIKAVQMNTTMNDVVRSLIKNNITLESWVK